MNPCDVRSPTAHSVWLLPLLDDNLLVKGVADLRFGDQSGEYVVVQGDRITAVRLKSARRSHILDTLLGSGRARIATIDQVVRDGRELQMTIRCFNGDIIAFGDIDVGIDEHAYQHTRRLLGMWKADVETIAEILNKLCVLRLSPAQRDAYFLLTAGAAAEKGFEVSTEGAASTSPEVTVPPFERAFCIHGDGIRIAVASKKVGPDETKYLATRLTTSIGGDADGAIRLARGRLTFSNFTRTGPVQAIAAGAMARLTENQNGYLKKWDEYGAEEGKLLLDRARKVGVLRWARASQLPRGASGIVFHFAAPLPDALSAGDELEIVANPPAYVQRPDMSWAEYLRLIEEQVDKKRERRQQEPRRGGGDGKEMVVAEVLEISDKSLVLDLPIAPDREDLCLVLSLSGDRTQIERRMEARKMVQEGRSANPMLGVIIEENGKPQTLQHFRRIKPLSAFVKDKVFKGRPPTRAQEDAIRIALETPDIAIIQGPPGTGKTTVIAAIVERLNELSDKERSIQGEVLVSAFQHDAIENMMARLTVNSIPVPKFGHRSGMSELGDRNAEQMRRWGGKLAASVRQKNPHLQASEKILNAELRCREYILAPSLDNALGTIDAFIEVPERHLPSSLMQAAKALKARLVHERDGQQVQEDADILRALWRLRTSSEGFQDDGPEMAQSLVEQCGKELQPAERELLMRAARWFDLDPPPFLDELRALKSCLLERYRPQVTFRLDKPRKDVLDFVEEASRQLQAGLGASNRDRILAEFLHELESNPAAVQRAAEEYGFVFAATCQQSQGWRITRRKLSTSVTSGHVDYDTVIIDEAARVSPRDLLIPMVQARRRIILVGDHRQLPHMINEEIARTLEARDVAAGEEPAAIREDSYVRRSMFHYLRSRLEQLEAHDRIQRWVTLDQQFRMHPLLGKFVSDHFYLQHREEFTSPIAGDKFSHGLPGIPDVPAVWIDVPARSGEQERGGTSWTRVPEAHQIAKWLKRWIDSPAGRRLTFGIISFYKAQTGEVFQALSSRGYTTRDEAGNWRISKDYLVRPPEEELPPEERLRIGTVDAFQGMEFDMVFLSMVRSRRNLPDPTDDPAELTRLERTLYGHLTSPNRLCVSMSRQKRLLVVVGDKAMVEHEVASRAVPGLVGFLQLCKAHGAVFGMED